jgi:hypothetical protein
MSKLKNGLDRVTLDFDKETMFELWEGVYFEDSSVEINAETYTHIDVINTSDYSDGESHDYIIQRKSDNRYFKFNVWEAGGNNGYIFSDGDHSLTEVFPETKTIYK